MKKIIKLLALILTLSIFTSSLFSCNMSPEDENEEVENESDESSPKVGNKIGNLCITTSLELVFGGTVNPKDYLGKIVVINFWGTWCDPCKRELPHFDEVAEEYSDSVVILTVHSNLGIENAPSHITENFANSKMVFAMDKANEGYYRALNPGQNSYPITLILDAQGVIRYKVVGDISKDTLTNEINKIK